MDHTIVGAAGVEHSRSQQPAKQGRRSARDQQPAIADAIASTAVPSAEQLCFYGLCGGAGVTTLASAVGFGWDGSAFGLPEPPARRLPLVAVTRSNAHGLRRAQQEAAVWAAHRHAEPWQQLGLVVVADAPGRLPPSLHELLDLASGGWPRLWRIGWIEDLRLGQPPTAVSAESAIAELRNDLLGLMSGRNQPVTKKRP